MYVVRRVGEVSCIVLAGNPETDHLANLGVDDIYIYIYIYVCMYVKVIVQCVPKVQRPELEADHLPASSADVKNKWSCALKTLISCCRNNV